MGLISLSYSRNLSPFGSTGGWGCFNLSGIKTKLLLDKILTVDLIAFGSNQVLRTSVNNINSFVLCHDQFKNYTIICPVSFMESMKTRLLNLINLVA